MAFSNFSLASSLIYVVVGLALQEASASCSIGATNLLAFWTPIEAREDMLSTGVPTLLTGPKTKSLVDERGALIALVAEVTFDRCKEEGSCYLQQMDTVGNYLLVTYVRGRNVFRRWNPVDYPFGVGGWNNPLDLFVSVASSDFAPGTKLYIKELDGLSMPQSPHNHNGCVRVDDVASSSCSLAFFSGFFKHYKQLASTLPPRVSAEANASCPILAYFDPSLDSTI